MYILKKTNNIEYENVSLREELKEFIDYNQDEYSRSSKDDDDR